MIKDVLRGIPNEGPKDYLVGHVRWLATYARSRLRL